MSCLGCGGSALASFGTGFAVAATYSHRTKGQDLYCAHETGVPNFYGCGTEPGPLVSWFTVGTGFLIGVALLSLVLIAFAIGRRARVRDA